MNHGLIVVTLDSPKTYESIHLTYYRLNMNQESKLLVFVVGNSRSGTTMMGRIVGNHPEIYFFNELHYFEELVATNELTQTISAEAARKLLMRLFTVQRDGYLSQADPEKYRREAEDVVSKLEANFRSIDAYRAFLFYESGKNGKKYPCDQTPQNVFYLKEILELLPGAKIVNMVRDPRDVLLSQKRRWRRRFRGTHKIPLRQKMRYWVNYHPITIAKLWNASINSADAFLGNKNFFQLRFKDLVTDAEKNVRALSEFLGVNYTEEMIHVPQVGSSSGGERPDQKSIDPKVAERWKRGGLSQAELYICEKLTHANMEKHHYDFSGEKPGFPALIFTYLLFPLKLGVAFFLNLHRMKNIVETVKRRLR